MSLIDRCWALFSTSPPIDPNPQQQQQPAADNSPLKSSADASLLIYSGGTKPEDLQRRVELRAVFRDQQLFNQLLPRSKTLKESWTNPGVKTWADHWGCDSQFMAMDSSRVFFSSAVSALVVSAIATPFDVVKNYWIYAPQFRGARAGLSTREVVRSLYQNNGLKSFYTGFAATCCTLVPSNLIFFYVYEHYRNEGPAAISSIKARVLAVICTTPMEYVRTRLQANVGQTTFAEIISSISAVEGVRSYTKGVIATLLRDAPFSAVYWTLNEKLKLQFVEYDRSYKERSTFCAKFAYPFISGATAAAVATTMTQPFDVIKTNIQGVDNVFRRRGAYYKTINGVGSIAGTIWKDQGFRGFFVGLTPRIAKIMPCCAVLLASYDFAKATFTTDPEEFEIENF